MVTTTLALAGLPAAAETVRCAMSDSITLSFDIDRSQFSPALDPNDPPRQARTTVRYGERQFPAAPFLLGDARGFEAEGLGGSKSVFVMQPDGTARFSDARTGSTVTGVCTATENEQ